MLFYKRHNGENEEFAEDVWIVEAPSSVLANSWNSFGRNDGTTGLELAASAVTVRSGTLHITNLHVDSKFVIIAEVNDVVAAVAGALGKPKVTAWTGSRNDLPPIDTYE